MKKLIEANYSKGFVLGFAYESNTLQIGLIAFLIDVNFCVIGRNLRKFKECLKDN